VLGQVDLQLRLVRSQGRGERLGHGQGRVVGAGRGLGVAGDDSDTHGVGLRFAWQEFGAV
jgi:hypothetical protein